MGTRRLRSALRYAATGGAGNIARRLTYPFRWLRARIRALLARRAHHAEVRAGHNLPERADRTPIFILGAPRSGTTLLYQLLVEGLEVGWLANAHAAAPSRAAEIEQHEQPRAKRRSSDFASTHGATSEPWGPSEAGEYWYRFFPRTPHELSAADATPVRIAELRAAVRAFANACAAPVVFKNVFNSLRIPVLARALPEARFLLIERDEQANARSLLAGRAKRGDLNTWWSARPAGADALADASPAQQVVWQVRRMNAVAHRELAELPPEASLTISYEELCADPRGVVTRVQAWLVASGTQVKLREAALPARFELRAGGSLDPELETSLAAALASAPSGEDAS
ncbi:MAG: sulfotransferase [Gaiellales bacterium]